MENIKLENGVEIEYDNGRIIVTTTDNLTSEIRFTNNGNTARTFLERDNNKGLLHKVKIYKTNSFTVK